LYTNNINSTYRLGRYRIIVNNKIAYHWLTNRLRSEPFLVYNDIISLKFNTIRNSNPNFRDLDKFCQKLNFRCAYLNNNCAYLFLIFLNWYQNNLCGTISLNLEALILLSQTFFIDNNLKEIYKIQKSILAINWLKILDCGRLGPPEGGKGDFSI